MVVLLAGDWKLQIFMSIWRYEHEVLPYLAICTLLPPPHLPPHAHIPLLCPTPLADAATLPFPTGGPSTRLPLGMCRRCNSRCCVWGRSAAPRTSCHVPRPRGSRSCAWRVTTRTSPKCSNTPAFSTPSSPCRKRRRLTISRWISTRIISRFLIIRAAFQTLLKSQPTSSQPMCSAAPLIDASFLIDLSGVRLHMRVQIARDSQGGGGQREMCWDAWVTESVQVAEVHLRYAGYMTNFDNEQRKMFLIYLLKFWFSIFVYVGLFHPKELHVELEWVCKFPKIQIWISEGLVHPWLFRTDYTTKEFWKNRSGRGVGGRLKKSKKNLARAGWPRRLALVRATSRAEVDVIGVQRC